MTHTLLGRDFLSLADLSDAELRALLDTAADLKSRLKRREPHPLLAGRTLAMIFQKPSTRTRVGFEVAMTQLGGHAIYLSSQDSQLGRGETIGDTARVLSRMCDAIMARVYRHSDLLELAEAADVPVINGLSDLLHPVQALADLLTVREHFGALRGLKIAYVGDGNNVTNSLLEAAPRVGMHIAVGAPAGCQPDAGIVAAARAAASASGASVLITEDPAEAVEGAHVIYGDVWTSMGQAEDPARLAALQPFQINQALLAQARPDARVMHCLPMHRGEEITAEVADGPRAVIFDQAENRLHTHKAVLALLLGDAEAQELAPRSRESAASRRAA